MTESIDTITNYTQNDTNNDDNSIDLFVIPIHQPEHVINKFGLLDDDDDDNLTLLDLKFIPKSDYDLSIFDELAQQCNAVLRSSNRVLSTTSDNSHSSNLMTTTMINDYERRFQCSLRKLTVPSWYTEPAPSPKVSNKPLTILSSHYHRETHRTPEIVHVQRPHSYRSYRSSVGTSPSPSVNSWHPNHMMDSMNFSSLLPSSSSTSRRHNKHEKGIERVTKSSHWYQPTQFIAEKIDNRPSTPKIPRIPQKKSKSNHYDIPKFYDNNDVVNSIKQSLIPDKNMISGISIKPKINNLMDDAENTSICKQKNDNMANNLLTKDKQHDYRINSNGFQTMPLANEKISFGRVELEEVTDEEENDKRSSTNNINIPSAVGEIDDDETNTLLEHIATNLVDSILNDVLLLKHLEHDDDTDTGVRELSDDENALRELDENDMNGTDEFIVFSTKAEAFDDDDQKNQISPTLTRSGLNRLYTFSRTNDDGTMNSKISSNQNSPKSPLMTIDKKFSITNSLLNTNPNHQLDTTVYHEHDNSLPIYRSHIQKRHINLGRYYDGMMRATNSQLPTHDLRCNLSSNNTNTHLSSDGVNEETVRRGRLLLDSIPNSIDYTKEINANIHNESVPVRSILKNTRFALSDEINDHKTDDHVLRIEEKEKVSPKKIITTFITEEYRRIQRKIIEEIDEGIITTGSNEEICRDSDYSSNQEQHHTQQSLVPSVSINDQSPYELLSECYSGYGLIRNGYLKPRKSPLTSNVSSLQSTTDEAYESEPTTTSPRSPTMSSSTNHIHPDLEHEFEYPTPPPPVPDRSLKPAHLRPPPPHPKPRTHKQQHHTDPTDYSNMKKRKSSPLTAIKHLLASTSNDSTPSSTRTLSSRHYCGTLPQLNETTTSPTKTKTDQTSRRNNKTLNGLNSSTNNDTNQQITFRKSSSSSLNRMKSKRSSSTCFEETTNGLAIRLPAPVVTVEHDSTNKQDLNRTPTPSSITRTEESTQSRPISENLIPDRSSVYETSV